VTKHKRRDFLRGALATTSAGVTLSAFPPSIRKALAIPARRVHGDIRDVEHIVILMQENRSFDHYFGTLAGVRGFGERFPIPVPNSIGISGKTVWYQSNPITSPSVIAPFHLDTQTSFQYMRVTGTPHTWPNAVLAWADGKLNTWPLYKNNHSLGYFTESDIPFQFALANAFTICDAYHCSFHGGTNPNRVFLWTGTNDPLQRGNGPVVNNAYDNLEHDPDGGYSFTTYAERLEQAGVSWQIYQNMADNFTDNPVAGFRSFRAAYRGEPGSLAVLKDKGLTTRDLDKLKEDVLADQLPQVSWIVGTAEGSEHPGPSSPAQGAEYRARVLEALTASPDVWAKTVLIVNFDENDGFFDHMPPPAAPSYQLGGLAPDESLLAGASTVDTAGEYHEKTAAGVSVTDQIPYNKPYGLGPRVPLYVLSPWSKGGWVNSQVFDHTSVIRFIEKRFAVQEPNITAWRRVVCGDLTSAFNFADPDNSEFVDALPDTTELAQRARALLGTTTPPAPELPSLPEQARGLRPSRALPYALHTQAAIEAGRLQIVLRFENVGAQGAVFHVYNRKHLDRVPRRYTVESNKELTGEWNLALDAGAYDLWVLGPNGFHRHFKGRIGVQALLTRGPLPEVELRYDAAGTRVRLTLKNPTRDRVTFKVQNAYESGAAATYAVAARGESTQYVSLTHSANWYDLTVNIDGDVNFLRRFAGRLETGSDTWSDPLLGGPAIAESGV